MLTQPPILQFSKQSCSASTASPPPSPSSPKPRLPRPPPPRLSRVPLRRSSTPLRARSARPSSWSRPCSATKTTSRRRLSCKGASEQLVNTWAQEAAMPWVAVLGLSSTRRGHSLLGSLACREAMFLPVILGRRGVRGRIQDFQGHCPVHYRDAQRTRRRPPFDHVLVLVRRPSERVVKSSRVHSECCEHTPLGTADLCLDMPKASGSCSVPWQASNRRVPTKQ